MHAFIHRCPVTGLRVQGLAADEDVRGDRDAMIVVACHACGGAHLVNPRPEAKPAKEAQSV